MRVIEEAATDRAQTPHGARAEDVRSPRHEGTDRRVHPFVECAGSYAWRLLTIGLAVAALLWLLGHVLVVVVPVAVAFLLPAPRGDVFVLDGGCTCERALGLLAAAGHTRAPVRRRIGTLTTSSAWCASTS